MSYYECVFLVRPDVSSEQVESLADLFTKTLEKRGGKVVSHENWGLRNLTYRIKKTRKAHYLMLNIDSPGDAIHELERNMRINEDVIRYLTIKVDELNDGPSLFMQDRPAHDEKPARENRERDNSAEAVVKAETDFKEANEVEVATKEKGEI